MRVPLFAIVALLVLSLFGIASADVMVYEFEWGGASIEGAEDEGFLPSGTAVFTVNTADDTMTLELTNTSGQDMTTVGQALTGATWDVEGDVTLTATSAVIADGSELVNPDDSDTDDLSGEWAYKDDIAAGSSEVGPIGSHGVGSVGDINFGADGFGPDDLIDPDAVLTHPASPGGVDYSILGTSVDDWDTGGFKNQGPFVYGGGDPSTVVFTFQMNSSVEGITNFQPMFGSNGQFLVPEPMTLVLWGAGLAGLGGYLRRRKESDPPAD